MASDPTQFAPVNTAAAASRRLASLDPNGQIMMQTSNVQAPPGAGRGDIPLPAWNDPVNGNPRLGGQGGTPAPAQNAGPTNPLAGGTGDPNLDNYLGTDTTYQGQLSDLMRQYDMYNAQKNLSASQTQADYDAKQRALQDQSAQDTLNMRNAAAARGILQSGIYANELGQYNTANQQQMTNLLGGLQNSKDNAQLAYNNFISNELSAKANAIQQAAARRASQLGQF